MMEKSPRKIVRRPKRRIHKLGEFKLAGFAMANAPAGAERVPILTRATLFSDNPFFHHCLRAFAQEVDTKLRGQGISAHLAQASNFAVVVDPDFTATLYIDCLHVSLEMVAKRAVEKGEAVFSNDIGDIYRGSIDFPKLRPDQHFIICLRNEWKFLLIFDLTPEQPVDLNALGHSVGLGMRRLMFEQLYQCMADETVLAAMISKGWFPFNEIIGAEFEDLQKAVANDFNLEAIEALLVRNFNPVRLAHLLDRWWRNPHYDTRRELLREGIALFSEGRHIASIKTLMTEIEGILREHHTPRIPGKQGMEKILSVAFEEVPKIAGEDTIYFPGQFVDYLHASVFTHFDPNLPATDATRNTVGHGRAPGTAYTPVRALQTILILDQINRYLTLPSKPFRRRSKKAAQRAAN